MKAFALFLLATVTTGCAATRDTSSADPWVTVEPGRHWSLVGEWTLPNPKGSWPHYTLSILNLGDGHVLVWDGDLIAGCCPWPEALRLTKTSDLTYLSSDDKTEYTIQPDASLMEQRADGRVVKLSVTPAAEQFSSRWK